MTKITGGVVSVEDGIKKAEEYSPARKVRVELHFDVPEDASPQEALAIVSAAADEQVKKLLNRATSDKERLADQAGIGHTAVTAALAAKPRPIKQPGPRTAGAGSKEPVHPAEALARTAELMTKAREQLATEASQADPAAVVDEFTADEPVSEITDAELYSAASKKAGETKNPSAVKKLVGDFRPAGHSGQFSLQQIPQSRRKEFLTQLHAVIA